MNDQEIIVSVGIQKDYSRTDVFRMLALARKDALNSFKATEVMGNTEFLEELAALEHEQWEHWSRTVWSRLNESKSDYDGAVALDLERRWKPNWKPYAELPDDVKEHDRKWARKIITLVNQGYSFCYEKGKQAGQSTKCRCIAGDTSEKRCICHTAGQKAGREEERVFLNKNKCEHCNNKQAEGRFGLCYPCYEKAVKRIAELEAFIKKQGFCEKCLAYIGCKEGRGVCSCEKSSPHPPTLYARPYYEPGKGKKEGE